MKQNLLKGTLVAVCLLSVSFFVFDRLVRFYSIEIDKIAYASHIQDGDTFQTSYGDWIRLADVDAPENWESGHYEATNVLSYLIANKKVILDVDDISVTDPYGRLVCLVYVDHNATHYLNVNLALLVFEVAVVDDYYNNEFSPYEWKLFIPKLGNTDIVKFLGISLGFGFITTLIVYTVTKKVWITVTSFIKTRIYTKIE